MEGVGQEVGQEVGACCGGGEGCKEGGAVGGFGGRAGVRGVQASAEGEAAQGGGVEGAERRGGEPEQADWCCMRHL